MREFEIAPGRLVGDGHPAYVIAEIGQNHQASDLELNHRSGSFSSASL